MPPTIKPPAQADATRGTVLSRIAEIQRMAPHTLRDLWTELMDIKPPNRVAMMRRRLIYRVQELAYGGVSQKNRQRLNDIIAAREGREKPKVMPGALITRVWHGHEYTVEILPDGYLYDGKTYRSLSAIAKTITGQHMSGNAFFGLATRTRKGGGA